MFNIPYKGSKYLDTMRLYLNELYNNIALYTQCNIRENI